MKGVVPIYIILGAKPSPIAKCQVHSVTAFGIVVEINRVTILSLYLLQSSPLQVILAAGNQ